MKETKKLSYPKMRFWNNSSNLPYCKLFLFSIFCLILSSCSPNFYSTIVSLTSEKFEQTDSSNVKVFASEKPKDAYKEICLVRVPIFRRKVYDLGNLKIVAAQQGADAVVDLKLSDNFVSGVAIKWR